MTDEKQDGTTCKKNDEGSQDINGNLEEIVRNITSPNFCLMPWKCVTMAVGEVLDPTIKKSLVHVHRTLVDGENTFHIKVHNCRKDVCDHVICTEDCEKDIPLEQELLRRDSTKKKRKKKLKKNPENSREMAVNFFEEEKKNISNTPKAQNSNALKKNESKKKKQNEEERTEIKCTNRIFGSKPSGSKTKPSCTLQIYKEGKPRKVNFQLHPAMEVFLGKAFDKIKVHEDQKDRKKNLFSELMDPLNGLGKSFKGLKQQQTDKNRNPLRSHYSDKVRVSDSVEEIEIKLSDQDTMRLISNNKLNIINRKRGLSDDLRNRISGKEQMEYQAYNMPRNAGDFNALHGDVKGTGKNNSHHKRIKNGPESINKMGDGSRQAKDNRKVGPQVSINKTNRATVDIEDKSHLPQFKNKRGNFSFDRRGSSYQPSVSSKNMDANCNYENNGVNNLKKPNEPLNKPKGNKGKMVAEFVVQKASNTKCDNYSSSSPQNHSQQDFHRRPNTCSDERHDHPSGKSWGTQTEPNDIVSNHLVNQSEYTNQKPYDYQGSGKDCCSPTIRCYDTCEPCRKYCAFQITGSTQYNVSDFLKDSNDDKDKKTDVRTKTVSTGYSFSDLQNKQSIEIPIIKTNYPEKPPLDQAKKSNKEDAKKRSGGPTTSNPIYEDLPQKLTEKKENYDVKENIHRKSDENENINNMKTRKNGNPNNAINKSFLKGGSYKDDRHYTNEERTSPVETNSKAYEGEDQKVYTQPTQHVYRHSHGRVDRASSPGGDIVSSDLTRNARHLSQKVQVPNRSEEEYFFEKEELIKRTKLKNTGELTREEISRKKIGPNARKLSRDNIVLSKKSKIYRKKTPEGKKTIINRTLSVELTDDADYIKVEHPKKEVTADSGRSTDSITIYYHHPDDYGCYGYVTCCDLKNESECHIHYLQQGKEPNNDPDEKNARSQRKSDCYEGNKYNKNREYICYSSHCEHRNAFNQKCTSEQSPKSANSKLTLRNNEKGVVILRENTDRTKNVRDSNNKGPTRKPTNDCKCQKDGTVKSRADKINNTSLQHFNKICEDKKCFCSQQYLISESESVVQNMLRRKDKSVSPNSRGLSNDDRCIERSSDNLSDFSDRRKDLKTRNGRRTYNIHGKASRIFQSGGVKKFFNHAKEYLGWSKQNPINFKSKTVKNDMHRSARLADKISGEIGWDKYEIAKPGSYTFFGRGYSNDEIKEISLTDDDYVANDDYNIIQSNSECVTSDEAHYVYGSYGEKEKERARNWAMRRKKEPVTALSPRSLLSYEADPLNFHNLQNKHNLIGATEVSKHEKKHGEKPLNCGTIAFNAIESEKVASNSILKKQSETKHTLPQKINSNFFTQISEPFKSNYNKIKVKMSRNNVPQLNSTPGGILKNKVPKVYSGSPCKSLTDTIDMTHNKSAKEGIMTQSSISCNKGESVLKKIQPRTWYKMIARKDRVSTSLRNVQHSTETCGTDNKNTVTSWGTEHESSHLNSSERAKATSISKNLLEEDHVQNALPSCYNAGTATEYSQKIPFRGSLSSTYRDSSSTARFNPSSTLTESIYQQSYEDSSSQSQERNRFQDPLIDPKSGFCPLLPH